MLSKYSAAQTRPWRVILFQALLFCSTEREVPPCLMLVMTSLSRYASCAILEPDVLPSCHTSVNCCAGHTGALGGEGISHVADLKQLLYKETKLAPACVRLLNATGTVGCGTATPVSAPLLHLKDPANDNVAGAWSQGSLSSCPVFRAMHGGGAMLSDTTA